jgi:flagellar protein FlaF
MGFSTSAATAVIFVGVLVSLSIVFPATAGSFEAVSDAMASREDRVLKQRNSDLRVDTATYDSGDDRVRVNVTNTGTVSIDVGETDLLIDGHIRPNRTTTVEGVGGRSIWAPGETLRITVQNVTTAPTRVTIVNEFGVADANSSIRVT